MIITYIFHSCYLIEFDQFSVLFDFYKDVPREEGKSWVRDYLLSKEQDLYVLCSHSHSDHFNPEILTWKKKEKEYQLCLLIRAFAKWQGRTQRCSLPQKGGSV